MKSAEVERFFTNLRYHKMHNAVIIALSLTEIIQVMCFGQSPSKVTELREVFGKQKRIKIDRIPYLYPMKQDQTHFGVKEMILCLQ